MLQDNDQVLPMENQGLYSQHFIFSETYEWAQ